MEIFRFIKWWWLNSLSRADRTLVVWSLSIIGFISSLIIFGPITFLLVFGFFFFYTIIYLIVKAVEHFKRKWREYKFYKEREAENIVDVLAGRPRK